MKPETRKRMDRLILLQRLKYGGIALAATLAVLSFMLFMGYEEEQRVDKVTATTNLRGTIVSARRGNGRNGIYRLVVKLENGKSVKTVSQLSAGIPWTGEQLEMKEYTHASGLKNYVVTRLIDNHH